MKSHDASTRKINLLQKIGKPELGLLVALIIITIMHLPLSEMPLGRDQGVWATVGKAISNGEVFFKDLLHFNLPGLGFSYAIIFHLVNDPRTATMLLSLAGSILTIFGMYLLLQQTVSKSAAACSVLLFAIMWSPRSDFWNIAQKDFLATSGVLLSSWLMARAESMTAGRRRSIYLSGFFVGLSVMYKPLFGIAGILLGTIHAAKFALPLTTLGDKTKSQWLSLFIDLGFLIAGSATVAFLFLLYLIEGTALEGFYNGLFVFAPAYSTVSSQAFWLQLSILLVESYIIPMQLGEMATAYFFFWTPLMIAGFAGLIKGNSTRQRAWLSIPFITALFTYFIQGKCFSYHTMPWQICLFMVVGYCIACWWESTSGSWSCKRSIIATIIAIMAGIVFGKTLLQTHYAKAEVPVWLKLISRENYLQNHFSSTTAKQGIASPLSSENLAEWIKQNSRPNDKLLVWGLECQLYVLSMRGHATDFPFDILLTSNLSGKTKALAWQNILRQQFIQQLKNEMPKFIVIVNNDSNPTEPVSSNEAIAFVPGFQTFLDNSYRKVKSVELFDVFEIKP